MQHFLNITKALSDENRVRILLMLRDGELCLCQIIEILGLAPSTISKHVDLLRQAGLVEMRKSGRWHFYRLAGEAAPREVQEVIAWAMRALENEPKITADTAQLCCVREADPQEWTTCYNRS